MSDNKLTMDSVVTIRFSGDSGDGMQLTGTQFSNNTAIFGNDLSTLPDFPAEIRAPAGSLAGVSSFQLQFGSREIFTPGDELDVLVAMNPAGLKVHLNELKENGILIINTDNFTPKNLKLAKYDGNPLEDSNLEKKYRVIKVGMTKLVTEALKDLELTPKEKARSTNMFALGLLYWLYERDMQSSIDFLKKKFKKKPLIVDGNVKALKAGYYYGETIEAIKTTYKIDKAQYKPGYYRNIMGNQALSLGLVAASNNNNIDLFYGGYPITPASDILHYLASYKSFGIKTFQAEDEIAGVTSAIDLGTPFQILELREKIRSGEIPGPRLTVSGPWISRISWPGIPPEFETIITTTEEAVLETRKNIENGSDVIKLWAGLTQEDYYAVVKEAHKSGIKVHAHLYDPKAIRAAINAKVDVFQHVGSARNPPYDEKLLSDIAHQSIPIVQTISHRIWVYPETVNFPERLFNPIHKKDMPADIYNELIDSFKNFHRLSYFHNIGRETRNSKIAASQFIKAGAYIGVGTDAASPLNFHSEAMKFEMAALIDSGMTPIQVISAATKTNAEILGKFDALGSIEPGKLADIIIVDGNPLRNIEVLGYVDVVIKDGVVWYSERSTFGMAAEIGHAF